MARTVRDRKYSMRNALRALLELHILPVVCAARTDWHDGLMIQYSLASDAKRRWARHDRVWGGKHRWPTVNR